MNDASVAAAATADSAQSVGTATGDALLVQKLYWSTEP
jgi:hypothetical protein